MNPPITAQVACIERELGFRRRVYARRVAEQKMTKTQADYELEVMGAVLATLQSIEAGERLL
jgi:hypothetical protein